MPEYIDTHCHLDHHEGLATSDQVERARAQGVTTLVTVGTDMASSTHAVQTALRHEGVWASVGVHPNDAMEATRQVLQVIATLAQHERVVAIGETGLDYYRDHTAPHVQKRAFVEHIALAKEHDKSLVVHCRDAWDDVLSILASQGPPERVVMHCFSGEAHIVERCADAGYFMSFAGNVTFHNAEALRKSAAEVPSALLLTETDSPFLSPHPHRGKPNEPARVTLVLDTLAEVRGEDADELATMVADNARRAFALPAPGDGAVGDGGGG